MTSSLTREGQKERGRESERKGGREERGRERESEREMVTVEVGR